MKRLIVACMCLVWPIGAMAQTPSTNLGTLTCTLGEPTKSNATPPANERNMRCAFKPARDGAEQTYTGTLRRIGTGDVPAGKRVMIWVVQGPAEIEVAPGLLEQTYVGARDSAAGRVAPGGMLVGERNKDIVLRAETHDKDASALMTVTVLELKTLSVPA